MNNELMNTANLNIIKCEDNIPRTTVYSVWKMSRDAGLHNKQHNYVMTNIMPRLQATTNFGPTPNYLELVDVGSGAQKPVETYLIDEQQEVNGYPYWVLQQNLPQEISRLYNFTPDVIMFPGKS